MAFYTPSWVRKLLKEESKEIVEYISKTAVRNGRTEFVNDFRTYVDSKMPFVLFLDITEIEQKVIVPNSYLISQYIAQAFPNNQQHQELVKWFSSLLITCYKEVINEFISDKTYNDISSVELESLLLGLNQAGNIREYLNKYFQKKYRITNITKQGKAVMLLTPSFTQLSNFGTRFSATLEKELKKLVDQDAAYIQTESGDLIDNPHYVLRELVNDKTGKVTGKKQQFTTQLHNVGHVEVDVVPEDGGAVKRGQLSPRLIQALVAVPKSATEKLQLEFSTETGQADTRVMIRKRFQGRKMVFELLVEYGFPVGIPEQQLTNLQKSTEELKFAVGKGLTDAIRKNPSILADLETSKSLSQYIVQNTLQLIISGKQTASYTSEFNAAETTKYSRVKVAQAKLPKPKQSSTKSTHKLKSNANTPTLNLTNLQNLLNTRLHDQIRANMGTGQSRNVLNYRSGRLAQSAKVERLSESRAGMITAFYTYMKYPYATFSAGGLQQYPKSRDPKLLIAKSIREIAGTTVANRMRAVNI